MQYKILSRSALKWIALITMLIDHIGAIIGSTVFESWQLGWLYDTLRTIGRVSFPIFAFFIAEGWFYTHSKKKYFFTLLIFAIITQPIYYFALNINLFDLNILFTFLLAICVFYFIDLIKQDKSLSFVYVTLIIALAVLVFVLDALGITVNYGLYGVFLPVVFYIFYHANWRYSKLVMFLIVAIMMILDWLTRFLFVSQITFNAFIDLFPLLSIPLLLLYNGQKGRYSPKWLFYIFYPAHILIIFLFTLLI